jgi:hypothetical protein
MEEIMAGKKEAEKKGDITEDLLREKMDELRSLKQELVDKLRPPVREEVPPRQPSRSKERRVDRNRREKIEQFKGQLNFIEVLLDQGLPETFLTQAEVRKIRKAIDLIKKGTFKKCDFDLVESVLVNVQQISGSPGRRHEYPTDLDSKLLLAKLINDKQILSDTIAKVLSNENSKMRPRNETSPPTFRNSTFNSKIRKNSYSFSPDRAGSGSPAKAKNLKTEYLLDPVTSLCYHDHQPIPKNPKKGLSFGGGPERFDPVFGMNDKAYGQIYNRFMTSPSKNAQALNNKGPVKSK